MTRAAKQGGGVQTGVFSRSGLVLFVLPFCPFFVRSHSFVVLFRPFFLFVSFRTFPKFFSG